MNVFLLRAELAAYHCNGGIEFTLPRSVVRKSSDTKRLTTEDRIPTPHTIFPTLSIGE